MANKIASVMSNRQGALQMTGAGFPSSLDQLVTVTAVVIDDQTQQPQPNVPVYWGFASVNSGTLKFFTMDHQEFDLATGSINTGSDGTASLYVGSDTACIPQILASLSPSALRPDISEQERQEQKATVAGTTTAIWTVGNGGHLPAPTILMDSIVRIPPWMGGSPLPPLGTEASALLGSNDSFGADASYAAWMCQGDDTTVLGEVLTIGDYNGQSITVDVPYVDMQTGPQSSNNIAYMIYSGRQGNPSQIYNFSATGTPLQRPDDTRHPRERTLQPVLYQYGDGSMDVPPTLLTYDDFDPDTKVMTWAIPDYNNPNGELRVKTDKIVVTGYGDAWHHASTNTHYTSLELTELTGDDFSNGYATFTMNKSDWQDYCHNIDSNLYGRIWIQYVINGVHYSQSTTTLINFCQD